MFSLVQFDNDELQIVPTKRVYVDKSKKCVVNYKGSKYCAVLLKKKDSKQELEDQKKEIKIKNAIRNMRRVELGDILVPKNQASTCLNDRLVSETLQANQNEEVLCNNTTSQQVDCNPNDEICKLPTDKLDISEKENINSLKKSRPMLSPILPEIQLENKNAQLKYPIAECFEIKTESNYFNNCLCDKSEMTSNLSNNHGFDDLKPRIENIFQSGISPAFTGFDNQVHDKELSVVTNANFDVAVSDHNLSDFDEFLSVKAETLPDLQLPCIEYLNNIDETPVTSSGVTDTEVSHNILQSVGVKKQLEIIDDTTTDSKIPICDDFLSESETTILQNCLVEKSISTISTNINDSTFVPDETISLVDISNNITQNSEIFNDQSEPVDLREIVVPPSKTLNRSTKKKNFCPFCNKLQSKFARHLELVHKSVKEVKNFIELPKGNPERKKIIEIIRKKGNFIHNTQKEHNTGILITCRQQLHNQNSAEDYVCCKNCKGFFSKKTLRLHYSACCRNDTKKGVKQLMVMGRKLAGYIHPKANLTLRRKVFPVLRDDQITRLIKYDELIIIFGNKLCEKYTLDHQHDMIRSHLRLLGRFLTAAKAENTGITNLASVFQPKFFDTVLESIKKCASFDNEKLVYGAPSVATTAGTLVKKCLKLHMSECIKSGNVNAKQMAEDFLILFDEDIPTTINRKVTEDQQKKRNQKFIRLPSKSDISCLYTYLKNKMSLAYEGLSKQFSIELYNSLAETTLLLLQTFNRRRAGEIERLLVVDYNKQETINDITNSDLYDNISPEMQEHAKQYCRITIRGKLGRIVPVLMDSFIIQCIDLMLKNRQKAGISAENEYIFAVAGNEMHQKKYLRACFLMRKYSQECGAQSPSTLRGTALRKQVATHTAMVGMNEYEVSDLANFMGHHKDIHKNIYRVPVPIRDLANVSKILENSMGIYKPIEETSTNTNFVESRADVGGDVGGNVGGDGGGDVGGNVGGDGGGDVGGDVGSDVGEEEVIKPISKHRRTLVLESDESEEDNKKFKATKRRSTSPFGKTKRVRWNDEEKSAIIDCFGDPAKCIKLPTLNQCWDASKTHKALEKRTPQQIKTWIDNQRKAEMRHQSYKLRKSQKP